MTETNNTQGPEDNTRPAEQPEGDLREELARVRNKNKTLKAVSAAFLVLFIIVSAVGFFIYRKITATKAAFEEAFQGFTPPPPVGYHPETRPLPMEQGVYSSTDMPASSLGLITGGLPGEGAAANFDPAQGQKVISVMNKYADRPIVKEFIADLKKDPAMAAAFAASKGTNPLAVLASAQNVKGLDKLMLKYSTRPEFMKLMMELMNDPDLKAFTKGLPAGRLPPGMPPAGPAPSPAPSRLQPRASQAPAPVPDAESGGEMVLDTSVISGTAEEPSVAHKKVPLPD